MKAFTDLEQSKKLAEILPIESADMYYSNDYTCPKIITKYDISFANVLYGAYNMRFFKIFGNTPCWTLAALLDVLKDNIKIEKTQFDQSNDFTYSIIGDGYDYATCEHENLVDACVEMIIKLHEQNLLVI